MPEGQLGRFGAYVIPNYRKQKIAKANFAKRGPFAKTSRQRENKSCTTLLKKWLSNVRRNDFVANNSRMSIDRPKPANTITTV